MLLYAVMLCVTSVLAIASVMQVLFSLPFWLAVMIGGGVVVVYSTIGGMWSLTLTDIVQFLIKTIGLMFILLPICLHRVGGWEQLEAKLPASYFSFTSIGGDTILTYFVIYFFGILIGQDIWQRVFTARSAGVARYAGTVAGLYCIVYGLVCAAIGMATKVLLPDLAVPANAFAAMVKDGLLDGIRGLVIAAALAAMMSTASAALLAASTTLSEDLMISDKSGLWVNRMLTLLVGGVVLLLAMVVHDVLTALTLAYNLLVAGMLVPLLGAIFWPRATTAGAIVSMVLGCGTAILAMVSYGLDSNLPIYQSLAVALVSFVLVSLMTARSSQVAVRL
jgi:SSS family solute:Na+ symporter